MNYKSKIQMELSLEQIQKMENELLFHIIRLCDKHGILYYMWVGSVLAAVKYKENIPWDDDVDIAIPNWQMPQFMKAMQLLPDKYTIACWENGDKVIHPLVGIKGYDSAKVHVDVFPLFGISDRRAEQEKIAYRAYLLKVLFAQKYENAREKNIRSLIKRALFTGITYKGLYGKFYKLLTETAYQEAKYIMFPNGTYGLLNIFDKEILGDGYMADYAGGRVRLPEKYGEYLTQLFGEYGEEPYQASNENSDVLVLERRKGLFKEATVWFAEQEYTNADIVHYKSCRIPVTQMCTGAITLYTDVQQTDEELLRACESNCRYKIRRAMREGDETFFLYGKSATDKDIEDFISLYARFSSEKQWGEVDKQQIFKNMKKYRDREGLIISYACVNGEKCVYHVYIASEARARLIHSCSLYRENMDKEMQKKIGMANRFLHYDDLRKMRDIGYRWCDWGGAGKRKEVYNIYQFKKAFGGKHTVVYDGTDYRNPVLRWLYWYYIYFTT